MTAHTRRRSSERASAPGPEPIPELGARAGSDSSDVATPAAEPGTPRVLLVDDDPLVRPHGEPAELYVNFTSAISRLWVALQPIVRWRERSVFGYEALLRSDEPMVQNPWDLLDAARRLGRLHEVGRAVRGRVAELAQRVDASTRFFVNLHASDLNDEELFSANAPLSAVAHRVVLEVTERASLDDVENVSERVIQLKRLGFQIAIDDLGTGYSGLTSFTLLEPEVAKIDMTLIRGLEADDRRRSIVRSIKALCDDLRVQVVAEGVETVAEREALTQLGCDLLQGYLFARPAREVQAPKFPDPCDV